MSELRFLYINDKKVFKTIFKDYYQPLCHLSRYYLGKGDEAEGVVQEAFITLWESRHELNPNSNLQNFLFTIVKNNCLNILKRRQILLKHHEKIREREIRYQYESLSKINDDYLEFNELKARIEVAIENLPEQ